jgi:hypothetical protein
MKCIAEKAGQLGTHSALADSGEPVQVLATALQVLLTTQAPAAALQVAETAHSKPDAQVAAADSSTGQDIAHLSRMIAKVAQTMWQLVKTCSCRHSTTLGQAAVTCTAKPILGQETELEEYSAHVAHRYKHRPIVTVTLM